MKSKIQLIIMAIGTLSLGVGIWQMLQTKTMILSPWFLLLFSLPSTLLVSFALGFVAKRLLKSKWKTLTFASIFVVIFCSIFYISEYRPVYTVVVPENYAGEIKLFVSNEKESDFLVNEYGIGYIDMKTFNKGFYPKILQGGSDITKQVKEYSKGALATMNGNVYSYDYLSFSIPVKNGQNVEGRDIEELIKIRAIDTARLHRR